MAATPFTLAALAYAFNALEPVIDAQTMEIHYTKHHQAYVNNLNAEVEKDANLHGKTLDDILKNVSSYSTATRNNAGGHWNHTFFWKIMGPVAESGKPSAELEKAIKETFGSVEALQEKFNAAGAGRFGSGWAWLIVNKEKKLEVISTPNQDNPLMDVAEVKGTPILGNDVWEHAYYLKYQNKRPDYLKAWWGVVNWEQVSKNFAEALK